MKPAGDYLLGSLITKRGVNPKNLKAVVSLIREIKPDIKKSWRYHPDVQGLASPVRIEDLVQSGFRVYDPVKFVEFADGFLAQKDYQSPCADEGTMLIGEIAYYLTRASERVKNLGNNGTVANFMLWRYAIPYSKLDTKKQHTKAEVRSEIARNRNLLEMIADMRTLSIETGAVPKDRLRRLGTRIRDELEAKKPHKEKSAITAWKVPKPDVNIAEVWQEYTATKSPEARNTLELLYFPLVKITAELIKQKLPSEAELDDLIASGLEGLDDAINYFDISRGVKFETYAAPRIRGAILDELRNMDWVPRLVRSRHKKVSNAQNLFQAQTGRLPDKKDFTELGITLKQLRDSEPTQVRSLSTKIFETDSLREIYESDFAEQRREENPAEIADRHSVIELVTHGFSRQERMIVILYYYEGLVMKEIGKVLDLSESRVSQVHSSILKRLRNKPNLRAILQGQ